MSKTNFIAEAITFWMSSIFQVKRVDTIFTKIAAFLNLKVILIVKMHSWVS
jgi:hypothetical protein